MESYLSGLTNRGPSAVEYEKVVKLMTASGTNSQEQDQYRDRDRDGYGDRKDTEPSPEEDKNVSRKNLISLYVTIFLSLSLYPLSIICIHI